MPVLMGDREGLEEFGLGRLGADVNAFVSFRVLDDTGKPVPEGTPYIWEVKRARETPGMSPLFGGGNVRTERGGILNLRVTAENLFPPYPALISLFPVLGGDVDWDFGFKDRFFMLVEGPVSPLTIWHTKLNAGLAPMEPIKISPPKPPAGKKISPPEPPAGKGFNFLPLALGGAAILGLLLISGVFSKKPAL